jgi:hypothetical protein
MLSGTAGIDKSTILNLPKHNPSAIYFTGRNTKNAEAVIAEVKIIISKTQIELYPCDLPSPQNQHGSMS